MMLLLLWKIASSVFLDEIVVVGLLNCGFDCFEALVGVPVDA
jgi:hypothetical protein